MKFQQSLDYPASLTSSDTDRVAEAEQYIARATKGFDRTKPLLILGCGDGYEVAVAHRMGFRQAVGQTWHPAEYNQAQQKGHPNVQIGDMHDLPYRDGEFWYVISKETLEHAMAPYIVLCELNRVMHEHGRFVHYIPEGMNKQREWYHLGCFPDWVWVDLFYKAGLSVESVRTDLAQNRFEGVRFQAPLEPKRDRLYDLEALMKRIRH